MTVRRLRSLHIRFPEVIVCPNNACLLHAYWMISQTFGIVLLSAARNSLSKEFKTQYVSLVVRAAAAFDHASFRPGVAL